MEMKQWALVSFFSIFMECFFFDNPHWKENRKIDFLCVTTYSLPGGIPQQFRENISFVPCI